MTATMEKGRGAFLPATVHTLLDKLSSTEFIDYLKYSNLDVLLFAVLETTLLTLNAVLDDAKQKQFFNFEIKEWLDKLEDAISDAEDLFDEISYDSLQCRVENTHPGFEFDFNFRMMTVCKRLQRFAQQTDVLGLQQTVSARVSLRTPPSSYMVNESVIVGRNDDKERIMNMLLSDSGTNDIGVVAILGTGGVGKTTLAQLVYNDKQVQEHFDLKAWVSVSEDCYMPRVMKVLAESVTSAHYVTLATYPPKILSHFQNVLRKKLRDRRFLIVVDDLWIDSYNDWYELVSPLTNGKFGSRVIVTTCQQKVAEIAHTFPIHKLEPLSDEGCWSLLSKHAFGSGDFGSNKYGNLESIGRKIARKCGGLPIAAKTLGGLLRSKVDVKEWTSILNCNIWNLPNDNIVSALLLCFQYLPPHLKTCFSYCSIFPKGYPLDRKQLVLLWMAEGFLEHSQCKKALEEVGGDYFIELLSRSLIQQSNDDTGGEKFVMHGLVYDLATFVSGKSCCNLECGTGGGISSKNVHHLSYNQEEYDTFKKFEIVCDLESLRSFLPIVLEWGPNCYLSKKVVDDLLPTLRRLRVLSLSNYSNITVLPDSFYNLMQLRYLDLSYTRIESLPDTICDLYYLQTLLLSCCLALTKLPVHIGKLINLRHLDISRTKIEEMPAQIVGLENLQTLTVFVVGKKEVGLSIKELGKFPNLRRKLCIQNLHNVIDVSEACDANLKGKKHIEELEVYWDKQTKDPPIDKVVLDALQPSVNLKKLSIGHYGGTNFPSWLGDSLFSNMVYLCINSCEYCATLPPLGQLPSLKDLSIEAMLVLETIGPEFYGMSGGGSNSLFQPFPSLEKLEFKNMSNWKEWLSFGGGTYPFPHLKSLRLEKCPELKGHLPSYLPSIEKCSILFCDCLQATPPTLHWLSSVKTVELSSLWSTELSMLESDSPCLLQSVEIFNFNMLTSLPKMMLSTTCLRHLGLYFVSSLTTFPAYGLPSLTSLYICECGNLVFLPAETWIHYTSLVTLELVNSCDALTSFPLDGFPMLQSLSIEGCRSLQSLSISKISSQCPATLQSLKVSHCDSLRSLPQWMDALIALESLTLDSLSLCCEGVCLPPKLRLIYIESLRITVLVTEWGLPNLSALSDLHIGGDDIVNTLLKEQLLSMFLVSLTITNLSELKFLEGDGLKHLSSMENLTFKCCSKLESLPKVTLPSFLKSLVFVSCPKLKSLPGSLPSSLETMEFEDCRSLGLYPNYRFPPSLKLLRILRCPLLKARIETQRREHMLNIAHIPVVIVNYKVRI